MKIFYDGVNIQKFCTYDFIEGFTTNPSDGGMEWLYFI